MIRSQYKQEGQFPASMRQAMQALRRRLCFVRMMLVCLGMAGAVAGCSGQSRPAGMSDTEKARLQEDVSKLFDEPSKSGNASASGGAADGSDESGWSVLVLNISGQDRATVGPRILAQVRREGLPEAFLTERGESVMIAAGRFDSPTSPEAQALLRRVRETVVNGERPYALSHMLPPAPRVVRGSMPEWDLRNARTNHGGEYSYTLQVNIYTNPRGKASAQELAEFRKAGEEAVRTLRKEGYEAFYYHDDTGSAVTVGLFTEADLQGETSLATAPGAKGTLGLREYRTLFPNAMVNGAGQRERVISPQGQPIERLRPSFLVRLP